MPRPTEFHAPPRKERHRRIVLISELLSPPYDEGMKKFCLHLSKYLMTRTEFRAFTNGSADMPDAGIHRVRFDQRLVSRALRKAVAEFAPSVLIYVPEAALTTNSLVRTWLLQRACPGAYVAVISLQPRHLTALGRKIIRFMPRPQVFVQAETTRDHLTQAGLPTHLLPSGVDVETFHPIGPEARHQLRAKYGFNRNSFVLLHVGHLAPSRNLAVLEQVASHLNHVEVVLVSSTSTRADENLRQQLQNAGVTVVDRFLPQVEEIYQLSDAYVFPVLAGSGAMELPLSVLEALACGIPVLSTRFGPIEKCFGTSRYVHFFEDTPSLCRVLEEWEHARPDPAAVRETVIPFAWDKVFDAFLVQLHG